MTRLAVIIVIISTFFVNSAFAQTTDAKSGDKKTSADSKTEVPTGVVPAFGKMPAPENNSPSADTTKKTDDKVEVESIAPSKKSDSETQPVKYYKYSTATNTAGSGLFLTMDALVKKPWTYSFGLHTEFFRYSDFIVSGQNEVNTRFAGGIHGMLFLPGGFELFTTIYSSSNLNERDPVVLSAEPKVQMALGDFTIGGKYSREIMPGLNVGGAVQAKFFSGVGEASPDLGATALGGTLIATITPSKLSGAIQFPLRFHINLGYVYDNSKSLMENVPSVEDNTSLQVFYQYLIREFALGIQGSRVQGSIGFEYPVFFGKSVISPIVEWGFRYYTDSADKTLLDWQYLVSITGDVGPEDAFSHNVILGARYDINSNFSLAAGLDITLAYPGYAVSPTLPVYNIFTQLTYRNTPCGSSDKEPSVKIVEKIKETIKYIDKNADADKKFISGKVITSNGTAIAGAIISYSGTGKTDQATDEMGTFKSYPLKVGEYSINVSRKGYIAQDIKVVVKKDSDTQVTVKLEKKMDPVCSVKFKVTDAKKKVLSAGIRIEGKSLDGKIVLVEQTTAEQGESIVKIKPGAYSVSVIKKGYLSRSKTITMTKCDENILTFELKKKPRRSSVRVNKKRKRISISKRIHFKYNSSRLRNDAYTILDEVASVLIENPDLLLVRIEGHTDNKGSGDYNKRLSQERADAVRSYLIKQGVKSDRLEAKGYGRSRPRYANISERLRRRNRRVEFKILKQKK
ncbi:MAG: OmpA family protein [Deltaproteobacteria bacterium]|nr:OmpA family protein [Deltaproteobacteria bacterium]